MHRAPGLLTTLLALVCGCLTGTVAQCQEADWPGWGGPGGQFRAPAAELATSWPKGGPREVWSRELGGGYGGMAVAGGRLFTQVREGDQELVLALDAATGRTLWSHGEEVPTPELDYGPGPFAAPLVAEGVVVFVSGTGRCQARKVDGGKLLWRRDLLRDFPGPRPERGFGFSPILVDGGVLLAVGAPDASLVLVDLASGKTRWARHSFDVDYATPLLVEQAGRELVIAHMEEHVVCLDPSSGDLLWQRASRSDRTRHVIAPVDLGVGRLLTSTTYGVEALELGQDEPKPLWSSRRVVAQVGNLLYLPGQGDEEGLFLGSSSALAGALLVALDPATGRVLWRERGVDRGFLWSVGQDLLALTAEGELVLARARRAGLRVLARHQVLDEDKVWSAPAQAGSRVFLKGQERLVALELGS